MLRMIHQWRILRTSAALLVAGFGLPCVATTASTTPVYLVFDAAAFRALLPPPPADDSLAGRADLTTVLWLQVRRTSGQISQAQELAAHTPFQMGTRAWGPAFTPERLPRTAEIFARVRQQTRPAVLAAKGDWKRLRPFQRDPRVQPCVPKPESASYPSGHSTESAIWAAILGAAFPEKAPIFQAEVEATMWSRVLGGVHYPTDTEAGLRLGQELARRMLSTEDMQSALRIMREEVSSSLK